LRTYVLLLGAGAVAITIFLSSAQWWSLESRTFTVLNTLKPVAVWIYHGGLVLALVGLLRHPIARRALSSLPLLGLLLVVVAGLLVVLHGHFLGNLMSDRAAAFKLAAINMLALRHPYAEMSVFNSPISPGPGWIALGLPFAFDMTFALLGVAWMAGTALLVRRIVGAAAGGVFLLIVLSSPASWENAWQADLTALGCAFVVSALLARRAIREGSMTAVVAAGVLAGFIGTGRLPFLALPLLLGGLNLRTHPARAITLAVTGLATASLLHLGYALTAPGYYHPLHLLGSGELSHGFILVGALMTAAVGVVAMVAGSRSLASYLWCLWAGLMVPMTLLTWSRTEPGGSSVFQHWPGSIYIVLAIPAVAAAFAALRTDEPRGIQARSL
jgi:hypothetical protein